ncbi:MAG: hypothetical protein JW941_06345 [Candidatus Coatesbacteria bacterium]|nr:hypothetical protein [Candidatus Coatesbacteria bacterium]
MTESTIIDRIRQKEDLEQLVDHIIDNPGEIKVLVNAIETLKGNLRYAAEKLIRLTSEREPALLYPHFDFFVSLLDSENSFLKWGAIITLSNLASVDEEDKFSRIFDKYYSYVRGPNVVSASNVVGNSWKIALAKPELSDAIVEKVLALETAEFVHKDEPSPECRRVVAGNAIESFGKFFDVIRDKERVIAFVERQFDSPRAAVSKRAAKFLKIYSNRPLS